MANKVRMWRNDERRILMRTHDYPQGLICTVRKRHDPWYIVTECHPCPPGQARHEPAYAVHRLDDTCTCGAKERCVHRSAVRQADPLAGTPRGSDERDVYGGRPRITSPRPRR